MAILPNYVILPQGATSTGAGGETAIHGKSKHSGIIGDAGMLNVSPTDFTENLGGLAPGATVRDALKKLDSLEVASALEEHGAEKHTGLIGSADQVSIATELLTHNLKNLPPGATAADALRVIDLLGLGSSDPPVSEHGIEKHEGIIGKTSQIVCDSQNMEKILSGIGANSTINDVLSTIDKIEIPTAPFDPTTHGQDKHTGVIGDSNQVAVDSAGFTGHLKNLGAEASVTEALRKVDQLHVPDEVTGPFDPIAHGEAKHVGVVGSDTQIKISLSSGYTENLKDLPSEATLRDILLKLNDPSFGVGGANSVPAVIVNPGGRLYVPPIRRTESQTSSFLVDAGQIFRLVYTPEISFELRGFYFDVGAVPTAGTYKVGIYSDNNGSPSGLMAEFPNLVISANSWCYVSFNDFQVYAGQTLHILIQRQTASFNIKAGRPRSETLTDFPDGLITKVSADGTSYRSLRWAPGGVESCAGVPPILFHGTENMGQPLIYGRYNGDTVPLYNGLSWSLHTIPIEGVFLNCESYAYNQFYYVYLYVNASSKLELECSKTKPIRFQTREVCSTDYKKLLVGITWLTGWGITAKGCPLDLPDTRRVRNTYNKLKKPIRKIIWNNVTTTNPAFTNSWGLPSGLPYSATFVSREEPVMIGVKAWVESSAAGAVAAVGVTMDTTTQIENDLIHTSSLPLGTGDYLIDVPPQTFNVVDGMHTVNLVINGDPTVKFISGRVPTTYPNSGYWISQIYGWLDC